MVGHRYTKWPLLRGGVTVVEVCVRFARFLVWILGHRAQLSCICVPVRTCRWPRACPGGRSWFETGHKQWEVSNRRYATGPSSVTHLATWPSDRKVAANSTDWYEGSMVISTGIPRKVSTFGGLVPIHTDETGRSLPIPIIESLTTSRLPEIDWE